MGGFWGRWWMMVNVERGRCERGKRIFCGGDGVNTGYL